MALAGCIRCLKMVLVVPRRWRTVPLFLLAVAMLAVVVAAIPAKTVIAQSPEEISPQDLLQRVAEGSGIELAGSTVAGDLDLRGLAVGQPIRCHNCRFTGVFRASNAKFAAILDLRGSRFDGPFQAEGASFGAAVLFGELSGSPVRFMEEVDFSFAAFDDIASFEAAQFGRAALFLGTSFRDDVSFANADFSQEVSFDSAQFDGITVFTGLAADAEDGSSQPIGPCRKASYGRGVFRGPASFTRTRFSGAADFHQRCFESAASFEGAAFGGRTNFIQGFFGGVAQFGRTHFDQGASFSGTRFDGLAYFQEVTASGLLNFNFVTFQRHADFFNLTSSGTVDFRWAVFGLPQAGSQPLPDAVTRHRSSLETIIMNQLSAEHLLMDLEVIPRIQSSQVQQQTLSLIESSAKQRSDLELANNARFRRLSLKHETYHGLRRLADWVYRYPMGYLVRPLWPLFSLLLLVFVGGLVRLTYWLLKGSASPESQTQAEARSRAGKAQLSVGRIVSAVLDHWGAALAAAFQPKPNFSRESLGLWIEYSLEKTLLVAFLFGLANSNPTLREMLDAIL